MKNQLRQNFLHVCLLALGLTALGILALWPDYRLPSLLLAGFGLAAAGLRSYRKRRPPQGWLELRALGDFICFGLLPGMLMFYAITQNAMLDVPGFWGSGKSWSVALEPRWALRWSPLGLAALAIPIAFGFRQFLEMEGPRKSRFAGISPSGLLLFYTSIFLMYFHHSPYALHSGVSGWEGLSWLGLGWSEDTILGALGHPYALAGASLLGGVALLVDYGRFKRLPSLSSKGRMALRTALLAFSALLFFMFTYKAVPLIVIFYSLFTIIDYGSRKHEIPR